MPSSTITPDQDAVVTEIDISAPAERIFRALIERDQALQWGSNPQFQMISWEMDARPGGKWRFVSKELGDQHAVGITEFVHHGEVLEVDPPRVLAYTWFTNWHEDTTRQTVVRWELTSTPHGTRVKVTHSGLGQMPAALKGYSEGWPGLLQNLRNYFES